MRNEMGEHLGNWVHNIDAEAMYTSVPGCELENRGGVEEC